MKDCLATGRAVEHSYRAAVKVSASAQEFG